MIYYVESEKRCNVQERKTVAKERPIMFASQRESWILSNYSVELMARLDDWYAANGPDVTVIAYLPEWGANRMSKAKPKPGG